MNILVRKFISNVLRTISNDIKGQDSTRYPYRSNENKSPNNMEIREAVFGGLTQSELNEIAKKTYRGLGAVIEGDSLIYYYNSASRNRKYATFWFDEKGVLRVNPGNGPNLASKSPQFFCDKILKRMQDVR